MRARDAGMEVVYEGIRLTPSQIARSAVDEGVHVIGLSILSGSHRELIPDVIEALREAGGGDIPLVVGGIIPDADAEALRAAGVAAVYTPKDFELSRILRDVVGARGGAQRHRLRRGVSGARARRAGCAERDLTAAPRGAQPRREPLRRGAAGDRGAARRRLPRARSAARRPRTSSASPGPPGAGKSTLLSALVRAAGAARGAHRRGARGRPVLQALRGALLGDRARIDTDPADRGVFIRSMAAGERLGGLAPATRAAAQALAAAFDVVVIETVGVGQSETEVAEAADTVAVIVQPGSGDALQFLKAGIMEVPDVLVVTKADLGIAPSARVPRPARRAALARRRDAGARGLERRTRCSGVGELIAALDAHREGLDLHATRVRTRRLGALADFVAEHGARGLRELGGRRKAERFLAEQPPEADEPALVAALEARAR